MDTGPCIFCHSDAGGLRSIEHIVPESLGNKDHVLPAGIVCDVCNNYFARKIEEPLLSSEYFVWLRSHQWVENKRGRVPPLTGILPSLRKSVDVWVNGSSLTMAAKQEKHQHELEEALRTERTKRVYIPFPSPPDQWLMSRFLGKVAVEALAARFMQIVGWRDELLKQEALKPLRDHVRTGDKSSKWNFAHRRLYNPNELFVENNEVHEILHEFTFVYTGSGNLFFVLALFGEEFAIDMGSPTLDQYEQWQRSNEHVGALAPWNNYKCL